LHYRNVKTAFYAQRTYLTSVQKLKSGYSLVNAVKRTNAKQKINE